MKKRSSTILLTITIGSSLWHAQSKAALTEQCMQGIPQTTHPYPYSSKQDDDAPVHIESDKTSVEYPNEATFSGHVSIQQGNRTLLAQQAKIKQIYPKGTKQPEKVVIAQGDVRYHDPQITLKGTTAQSNLTTKDTDIYNTHYQMVGRQGRGHADELQIRDNQRYTILKNGSFTSCLPGNNSWSIIGSTVIQDRDEEVAKIWNARFKIGSIPIFYSPYLQLPIGNKRRSGFLIPNAKYSSNNGFEFLLPYYWNIAPNYDLTITPHYISKRGLQWQSEFRYLNLLGQGVVTLDYLPSDKLYKKNYPDEKDRRWLLYWEDHGILDKVWRFNVNYTRVSDPRYFNDLDSLYGLSTDGYANQIFSLGYAQKNWNATLSSKQFQVFTIGGDKNAFRAEPQLDLNYYKNHFGPFNFHVFAQVAHFSSKNPHNPKATRWHIEPSIDLPLSESWGSLDTSMKLMATHYQQDIPSDSKDSLLKSSVNRVLPEFKVDGRIIFEREMHLLRGYTQTLEPRIQYLYVPFKDQSDIYTYDTTLLQTDYNGLFRDRAFSGLDRIASANQLSTGITSRIYDKNLNEQFNASIGQIYYFNASQTGKQHGANNLDGINDNARMSWAADGNWRINPQWGLKGGVQYNTRIDALTLFNTTLEYQYSKDALLQLNYRYASADYITAMLPNYSHYPNYDLYKNGLSQAGIVGSWPINHQWALVGAYYYDTKTRQTADSLVGLQYNTCCWAIRLGYEHKINNWDSISKTSQYDNRYSFNIELRGLGSRHESGVNEMLQLGILPYQPSF